MLIRRFGALAELDDDDKALLYGLPRWTQTHAPSQRLSDGGDGEAGPHLVVEGWACRMRPPNGLQRQIVAFILPGDILGFGSDIDPLGRTQVIALTAVVTLDASRLLEVRQGEDAQHSGLRTALRRDAAMQRAAVMDQLLRLGHHGAYERLANLLLELSHRMALSGHDGRLPFPLTQQHLADAIGLSLVHVNRTMRRLKAEGHIHMKSGVLELRASEALADRVGYRPIS